MPNNQISILCIDESRSFAKTAEGILKKGLRPASFTFVQNSRSALHHLSKHPVDLVLVGHDTPKFDGLQLMDDLRRRKIDTAVIMIPARGSEQTAVEAMKRGAYDYISRKELDPAALTSAVKNAISQKRMQDRDRKAGERIREQALQDALTGLYNHGHFKDLLEKEFRQARRYGYPLYCIMIDLDDFKAVNDTYGHLFGDAVLVKSAAILRKQMRDIDLLARYGGEEFAVVCTHIKEEGVLSLCERVRESFARHRFRHDGASVRVTISAGVACNEGPRVTGPEVLIRRADEALYEAKHRGKNNVCHWREKQSVDRLLSAESQKKILYYQDRFLGFTREIIDKFLEYSRAIVHDIEKKDRRTARHSPKVTEYALSLGKVLGLSDLELDNLRLAGMLHDIGKAGIDPKILYKKGDYSPREFRIMKLHPIFSVKMIEPLNFLDQEMQIILQHHERFDGTGYPMGRKGREIHRGGLILALCDAFDAMTSGRCYRKKLSPRRACEEITVQAGRQFDPQFARAFTDMMEKNGGAP